MFQTAISVSSEHFVNVSFWAREHSHLDVPNFTPNDAPKMSAFLLTGILNLLVILLYISTVNSQENLSEDTDVETRANELYEVVNWFTKVISKDKLLICTFPPLEMDQSI